MVFASCGRTFTSMAKIQKLLGKESVLLKSQIVGHGKTWPVYGKLG
jgi:hypothetical protein